jgi:hypothetical protein
MTIALVCFSYYSTVCESRIATATRHPPPNRIVLYRLRLIRRRWGWRALARLPRLLVRRLDGTAACGRSPSRDEQVVAQPVDVDADRRLALVGRHQAREGPMGQGQG